MYVVNGCNHNFSDGSSLYCPTGNKSDVKKVIGKSTSDKVNEDVLLCSNKFILAWNCYSQMY